ncbi:MAG TPA: histidine kinase [Candidatus Binatus sp.]|jgi:signal transduction histidine kinase|nr:histidine kinase [Candidatus Binatus sp.]
MTHDPSAPLPLRDEQFPATASPALSSDKNSLTWLNRRMRDLLMRAPSAIGITAGPLHRWVYVNMARATMAGRTQLEDFVGKTVRESYPELVGQPFFDALDGVYSTGVPFIGKELKATFNRGPGGTPDVAYLDCVYQPIRDENGEVEGLLIHTVEVTEKVLARRALELANEREKQARNQLESRVEERTQQLMRAHQAVRMLSGQLLQAQDEERRRVARELHDSAGQYLSAIQMNISAVASELTNASESVRALLDDTASLVERCTSEIRTISYLLHPPLLDELGLTSALSWYVEGFSKRSGIEITLDLPATAARFSPEVETAVFRVIQQSLANIHRHSGSKVAHIRLNNHADRLEFEISDEGSGFPQEVLSKFTQNGQLPGVGISGMRERINSLHGTFDITSHAKGTTIAVKIPAQPHTNPA